MMFEWFVIVDCLLKSWLLWIYLELILWLDLKLVVEIDECLIWFGMVSVNECC